MIQKAMTTRAMRAKGARPMNKDEQPQLQETKVHRASKCQTANTETGASSEPTEKNQNLTKE